MTRKRLEDERTGKSHSVTIGESKLYIQTGEYPDGSLGEIFLKLDKQGGELRAYDVLATCISIGLQHGVPVEDYVKHLKYQRMEPQGVTGDFIIPIAFSISDYLGKWIEFNYVKEKGNHNYDS